MYTPITKRVKVAQHKSSIAKSTEDEKKAKENNNNPTTREEDLQDEQGNKLKGKATGNEGSTETKKRLSYREAYDQDIEGVRTGGKYGNFDDYVADREKQRKGNPEGFEADMVAKTGVSGGPGQVTTTTPGDAKFSYEQPLTEASSGSSIDLFSSQELREASRAGKVGARNVKKASKQYDRMLKKFKAGKINQTVLDAYKDELANTVARSKNIGQQATGMRNRYITQRMEYGRGENLKGAVEGGQPIKAPEGTQTRSEFESEFKKDMGVNSGSNAPQTTTTPVSSFSAMASQNGVSYKPITLDNGALFQGLDSSISAFGNKVKKGTVSFKMKGYGSKR